MRQFFAILSFSCLLAFPAIAQEESDTKFFKDYFSLTKYLRANGVEAVGVNWGAVDNACLVFRDERNQVPYNKCRFEKAMDSAAFPEDSARCNTLARADYPDVLTSIQPAITITQHDGTTAVYQQPLSLADLRAKRNAAFDLCMGDKGWRDPANAMRGRSSQN